jgi:hypothetical protein
MRKFKVYVSPCDRGFRVSFLFGLNRIERDIYASPCRNQENLVGILEPAFEGYALSVRSRLVDVIKLNDPHDQAEVEKRVIPQLYEHAVAFAKGVASLYSSMGEEIEIVDETGFKERAKKSKLETSAQTSP